MPWDPDSRIVGLLDPDKTGWVDSTFGTRIRRSVANDYPDGPPGSSAGPSPAKSRSLVANVQLTQPGPGVAIYCLVPQTEVGTRDQCSSAVRTCRDRAHA